MLEKDIPPLQFVEQVIALAPSMIVIYDIQTRTCRYVNDAVQRLLGYSKEQFIRGGYPFVFSLVHPEDSAIFIQENQNALRRANSKKRSLGTNESTLRLEYRMRHKDGSWCWLQSDESVFSRDDKGNVKEVMNIAIDVTVRKKAELEDVRLRKIVEERQSFIESINNKVITSLDHEATLEELAKLLITRLADYARIVVINADQSIDELIISNEDRTKVLRSVKLLSDYGEDSRMSHGIAKIIKSGKAELIPVINSKSIQAIKHNANFVKFIKSVGAKSYMGVPLVARNKVVGAITFFSLQKERIFTSDNLKFAGLAAGRVALMVDNGRLYKKALGEIEKRKRAEQEIMEREKQYRNLIDLSPMPIAIHIAGEVVYANQKAAELVGAKSAQDFLGRNIMQFVHPDYREIVKKRVVQISKQKKEHTDTIEEKFVRLDGEVIDVEVVSMRVEYHGKNAIQVIIRDMTEEKRAEEKLRQSEERYRSIVETSRDIIVITNLQGIILYTSPASEKILGYTSEERTGKEAMDIIHPDDVSILTKVRSQLGKKEFSKMLTFRVKHKDGHYVFMEGSRSLIVNNRGEPDMIVSTSRDITERVQLEHQKDAFIGIASHELKTPVTSVKAYAQVLHSRFLKTGDEESALFLEKMNNQLDKLTNLINDLLDVTKLETGKLQLKPERFDFNNLISEITEEMERTTDRHVLVKKLGKSHIVFGDRDRIGQVMTNLLGNAIKYSPNKSNIIIRTRTGKTYISASVQDFGIGISKDSQRKVFDRFYRGTDKEQESYPGLGLGLFISSEIVKRHRGNIRVTSKKGQGSTFSFSLPVEDQL